MKLLNLLIDKFQATFSPNRLMLIFAGPITAASIWTSAWVTAHVPGVELSVGIVAGAIAATALITVTLIYKWFDQWQRGEPIGFEHDFDQVLDEFLADPEAIKVLAQAHPELIRELAAAVEAPPVAPSSSTGETT